MSTITSSDALSNTICKFGIMYDCMTCGFKNFHSSLGLTDPLETCSNNIQTGKTQS